MSRETAAVECRECGTEDAVPENRVDELEPYTCPSCRGRDSTPAEGAGTRTLSDFGVGGQTTLEGSTDE